MENNYEYPQEQPKEQSILRGVIGAVLGAIIGAIIWAIVGLATEQVSTVVGFLVGLLIGLGYDLFKGRKGAARIVTMLVCVVLAIVIGESIFYGVTIHNWYKEEAEILATGTDDEIARYYNDDEGYADYQAANPLARKLYISELKETFEADEAAYFQYMLGLSEVQDAFRSDLLQSLVFAVIGSALLLIKGGKTEQDAPKTQSVNFEEAALALENAPEQAAPVEASNDQNSLEA